MFDLSITKLLILGVLGLMIFGPEQLPKMAAQAGRALRELRRLADNAKADLSESLGPEFREFDLNDLNPRSFVRKHLLDDLTGDDGFKWSDLDGPTAADLAATGPADTLLVAETPPYDVEAT